MATDNLCHCRKPAQWLIRVVPNGGQYGSTAWAACDSHVADAARSLLHNEDMSGQHLELRLEE